MAHIPVLLEETIRSLDIKPGEIFVDATLGSAGHSLEICKALKGNIRIIGIDWDPERINKSQEILKESGCPNDIVEENFRNLDKILDGLGIERADKVLFDLGLNSEQLENSGRGFSFQKDEPLLMNFSSKTEFSAKDIVNEWQEENIREILWAYGDEKFSREIAKKIIELRQEKKIKTTKDLIEIIEKAVPEWYKHKKIHFATRTFQALRITVNDELGALKEGLEKAFNRLKEGGRIAVISFHALEDRLVKRHFKKLKDDGEAKILTKRPIVPERNEIKENPRSRSAKMRIIEKLQKT